MCMCKGLVRNWFCILFSAQNTIIHCSFEYKLIGLPLANKYFFQLFCGHCLLHIIHYVAIVMMNFIDPFLYKWHFVVKWNWLVLGDMKQDASMYTLKIFRDYVFIKAQITTMNGCANSLSNQSAFGHSVSVDCFEFRE